MKIYKRASAKWKAGTWLAIGDRDVSDLIRKDTRVYLYQGKKYLVYSSTL